MLTVRELAVQLNVKESWVRQQIFKKTIPYRKLQGLIRFEKQAIQRWLEGSSSENNKKLNV